MVSRTPHVARTVVGVFLLIGSLMVSASPLLISSASAVDGPPDTAATTPTQSNVAPNGPLNGLKDGDQITFAVTGNPTVFGVDIRLCRGDTNVFFQSQFNPVPNGNCLANPLPGGGSGFVTKSFGPDNTGGTATWTVGTGSDADTPGGHLGNGSPIVCDASNPCRFWLKESVPTDLVSGGIAWVSYDATFASTTPAVPGAPTNVSGAPGNAQATVSWTAPADPGGSAITSYSAVASPGGQTCSAVAPATSCTVTGLTNFTPVTFSVKATNDQGTGPASSSSSAVTPLPSAPGVPTGVPGDGQVAVSWAAASPAPTSYTATASPGGATCTSATTSCTVTGLTNLTPYTFKITATYALGTVVSGSSAPITPVPPVPTNPGAPTGVTAVAGNGQASVSWTAPAFDGNSPLASYTVVSSPAGGSCTVSAPATTCVVTGLDNFTGYTFKATAKNVADLTSVASAASASVTPMPSPPGTPTGTAGNARVTVAWTAASPVPTAGYSVTATPGGATCSTSTTTCDVTGLTPGITYTFVVTADYGSGHTVSSLPSTPVAPLGPPSAPTGVSATAGNGQATVSWSAPAATGGSPVTSYAVTASPGGASCSSSPPATTCVVTGLTNFTAYTFRVVATNINGDGPASTASNATTPLPTVPGKPSTVAGSGSVTVSWTAAVPAADSYVVAATPGGASCTTSSTSCVVSGLTSGQPYTFVVQADYGSNSVQSVASDPITLSGPPGAPTAAIGVAGNGQVSVSWTAPADGGSPILGYSVIAAPGGLSCTTTAPTTSCIVTGLSNFVPYTFTVKASNANGESVASAASAAVTPMPAAPGTPTATAGDAQASVAFTPASPAPSGGYTVVASPGGASATGTSSPIVVTGLTNGTAYTFVVTADYGSGHTVSSAPSASVTPGGVPAAPPAPTASGGSRQATISWSEPDANGSPVTGYTVTSAPDGRTCTSAAPTTSCVVTGLTDGVAYTFTVAATNGIGTGPASPASAAVTPATVAPDAPSGITVGAVANGQVTVSWSAPADPGGEGAQITGYTVTSAAIEGAAQPNTAAAAVAPGCVATTETSCTVVGLANFTAYTFSVTATNWAGLESVASAASDEVVPLPDKPAVTVGTPADGQVTLSWTPSVPAPTVGYVVAGTPGGTCSTSETSCTISGLTNGTPYTFVVTADFGDGNTVSSDPSAAFTPTVADSTTSTTTGTGSSDGSGSSSTGTLPITGSEPLRGLALASFLLVVGGALVVMAGRRRRRDTMAS